MRDFIKDIVKKEFDYVKDFIEIENLDDLDRGDFVYIVEVNNYNNNRYYTYCNNWNCFLFSCFENLQNRNIKEIDKVLNYTKLSCQEIIELYEEHENCKLYFFKAIR